MEINKVHGTDIPFSATQRAMAAYPFTSRSSKGSAPDSDTKHHLPRAQIPRIQDGAHTFTWAMPPVRHTQIRERVRDVESGIRGDSFRLARAQQTIRTDYHCAKPYTSLEILPTGLERMRLRCHHRHVDTRRHHVDLEMVVVMVVMAILWWWCRWCWW